MTTVRSASFLFFLTFIFSTLAFNPALAAESKAQLHLPWPLLSKQLRSAIGGKQSSLDKMIPSLQLTAGELAWNISNLEIHAQVQTDSLRLSGSTIGFDSANTPVSIRLEQIAVDQIVDRVVSGIPVHLHLKASCGPIVLTQTNASIKTDFGLEWSSGSPKAILQNLDLAWAASSWQVSEFQCVGPLGLPEILHTEIVSRLSNADDLKSYLVQYLSTQAQETLQGSLDRLRKPFEVANGSAKQVFTIGALTPTSTGVIADVSVADPGTPSSLPPKVQPLAAVLSSLPQDRPALIGGKDLLSQIMKAELAAQKYYFTIDLQQNKGFRDLMHSRFLQFFVWADLNNYPKTNPFYLQVFKPTLSTLEVKSDGTATSLFDLHAIVQSYRDSKWWTFVTADGPVVASVAFKLTGGVFSFATSLKNQGVKILYAPEYKTHYKKSGKPPSSLLLKAVEGNQPSLSGTMSFPQVDIGSGGIYSADQLNWLDSENFVLFWKQQN